MPPVKVTKTAAYEINGTLHSRMEDAEVAVRKQVILDIIDAELDTHALADEIASLIAQRWGDIKRRCDEAFKGI